MRVAIKRNSKKRLFWIGLAEKVGRELGGSLVHNTELSAYLYNKVISRGSDENVAILKSVKTTITSQHFWQDSPETEVYDPIEFY